MKKIISTIAASAIAFSGIAAAVPCTQAAGDSVDHIVILGDSISNGYGLKEGEYSYGEILADYTGAKVDNLAVAGNTSEKLVYRLSVDAATPEYNALKNADVVVISIGANDMMSYASHRLLEIGKSASCLKDQYADAEIPEEPSLGTVREMLDSAKLKKFADSTVNMITLSTELGKLTNDLAATTSTQNYQRYERVIETKTIPNIESIIKQIRNITPDAEIILQTVYNPLIVEDSFVASSSTLKSYASFLPNFVVKFDNVLTSFSKQLNDCAEANGAHIVDTYSTFSAEDENKVRYAWYFDRIEETPTDIHPNQAGNIAIAADVLDTLDSLGKISLHDDNGLIVQAYNSLANKDQYPAAVYPTLAKVMGDPSKAAPEFTLGDVNSDGLIDSSDASEILADYASVSTGGTSSFSGTKAKAADVNNDSLADSSDASSILSYYAYASTAENAKSLADFLAENG